MGRKHSPLRPSFLLSSRPAQKDKAAHEASISVTHDTYLGAMAVKHNLKDGKSKALRVVLEFVMTDGDVADIFTKERCDAWATPPP
jgi:hypothetical protein